MIELNIIYNMLIYKKEYLTNHIMNKHERY